MPGIIRPVRPPILTPTRGAGSLAPPYADQGGGSAWSPSKLGANLTLWIKETSLVGSPIDSMTNLGTAGGAFSATLTARATVATVNGLSAAVFDGTNTTEGSGPGELNVVTSTSAYSFVLALKVNGLSATAATSGWLEPNLLQDTATGSLYPVAITTVGVRSGHFDGVDKQTTETAVTLGTLYAMAVTYDGTNVTQYLNGGSKTVAAGAVSHATANALRLGASQGNLKVNVTLAELIGVNRFLTAAEVATARQYLVNKWGATL